MTAEERWQAFNDATVLVSRAFPHRTTIVANLYLKWDRCAVYLQHAISLKDCFREEKRRNSNFVPLQIYCELNNQCQR
jgi:hypothetical protein